MVAIKENIIFLFCKQCKIVMEQQNVVRVNLEILP